MSRQWGYSVLEERDALETLRSRENWDVTLQAVKRVERRRRGLIATVVLLVIGSIALMVSNGCGGEAMPEPAPVCEVPAGDVLIEHGCNVDGCELCAVETVDGFNHVDLDACTSPNPNSMGARCVRDCAECAP